MSRRFHDYLCLSQKGMDFNMEKYGMNIKMIVTDLDGTLLHEDKSISEYTIKILKQCRAKNIKIVYATGRGNISKAAVPSEFFDGFVRVNGAIAYIGDMIVYEKRIPIENVRDLLIAADNTGIKIVAECSDVHYANFNVTEKFKWVTHYEKADFNKLDIDAEKLYAPAEDPQVINFIKKYITDGLYLSVSNTNVAMVMHKEAVKSRAVAALAERWGITQNEIVAFGDDANDEDLLQYCGIGVAVYNAIDEIKISADYICDTNDNDGIAKWLEENVLLEK